MRPDDIGAIVDIDDVRVAPDGSRVAYVASTPALDINDYRSVIWAVPADGSAAPSEVSKPDERAGLPRWSPDAQHLAWIEKRGEGGSALMVDGTELAVWPDRVDDLAWSPDGTRLAFTARVRDEARYGPERDEDRPPRRIDRFFSKLDDVGWVVDRPRHLLTIPVDGSEPPALVTTGPFDDGGLAWSPDGTRLAFTAGRHETWDLDWAVDLYVVDASGGEPAMVVGTGEHLSRPSWSPDGNRVAFLWTDVHSTPRHAQVGVADLATGEWRLLSTALDRQCAPNYEGTREPMWDGDSLVFQVEDAGEVHVYRVPADGSAPPALVLGGPGQVTHVDGAYGVLAYARTTATALPSVRACSGGDDRLLAHPGCDFEARVSLDPPERFIAVSGDGTEVEAWILRPTGFEEGKRYPALFNVHGGPFTQYGDRFFDEFRIQAGAGYVVIYSNPRGSSGYSEEWGRAIRGATAPDDPGSGWGGVDYEDLMAVVDTALERFPFVDPKRIGVLGGSYGGYMATWMASHTDRFRAVCSERSCNNLLTMEWTCDFATTFRSEFGVSHLEDPEEYLRVSPITYVDAIHTPVLILHSEDDLRCPVEQAEQLFVALRLLGREVEFWRFPGESHELSRSGSPAHRVRRAEIILDFFGRHLSP